MKNFSLNMTLSVFLLLNFCAVNGTPEKKQVTPSKSKSRQFNKKSFAGLFLLGAVGASCFYKHFQNQPNDENTIDLFIPISAINPQHKHIYLSIFLDNDSSLSKTIQGINRLFEQNRLLSNPQLFFYQNSVLTPFGKSTTYFPSSIQILKNGQQIYPHTSIESSLPNLDNNIDIQLHVTAYNKNRTSKTPAQDFYISMKDFYCYRNGKKIKTSDGKFWRCQSIVYIETGEANAFAAS